MYAKFKEDGFNGSRFKKLLQILDIVKTITQRVFRIFQYFAVDKILKLLKSSYIKATTIKISLRLFKR